MSLRQSFFLSIIGFLSGATLATANLSANDFQEVPLIKCTDHYWGLSALIIDSNERRAIITLSGEGWKGESEIPATFSVNVERNEITFDLADGKGGYLRFEATRASNELTHWDGTLALDADDNEINPGACHSIN